MQLRKSSQEGKRNTPCFKSMSACHECHRLEILRSLQGAEREQRILAASRSARWALLHRVREF